jgi:signal peptidase I
MRLTWPLRRFRNGPWRVAVAEDSMTPALQPGDWLLLDPAPRRWPKRGSVVVVRQPGTGLLAIKRVAAGPGDVVLTGTGYIQLGDEAWLLGDGGGNSVDSRHYGPVALEGLVGRAWFRYWPLRRLGRVPRRRASSARARASIASKGKLRK